MIQDYIEAAMRRAHYEKIDDEEPYYGEIPGFKGVWATGKTLEECRQHLIQALEDWILFSIANGFPIPKIDNHELKSRSASPLENKTGSRIPI